MPLLIIAAKNDTIIDRQEIEATAQSYNAKFKIFDKIAHDMMLEGRWKLVADYVVEWIQTIKLT